MLISSLLVLLSAYIIPQCDTARILNINPVMSKSHHILASKLSRALANEGHDVTIVSPFSDGYKSEKGSYREIELTGFVEKFAAKRREQNFFEMGKMNALVMLGFFIHTTLELNERILTHPNMQKLIHSDEKFDVVLLEQFGCEALKALAPHFGAHLVLYGTTGQIYFLSAVTGTPSLPSYDPEFILGYTGKLNFLQRVWSTVIRGLLILSTELYAYPQHNKLIHKYISPDIHLDDIMYNVSIVFVNTHVSVAPALPTTPNMVFIGGFHLEEPKPLPKDLKKLVDNAKEGVVLFSMGTVLRSRELPEEKRDALLRVLGKLKQTVLWKYENDTLPGIPDNVKIVKWLPQMDLLAHPNLKLFITHCGYGSTTEIIYHGKPVLAMPVFGDQFLNAATLEERGIGRSLPFMDFTEEKLSGLLSELLDNPKYTETAKRISEIYRDRQVKPIDEVLYWIDYVVKYNGAPHLRSVTLDLPFYQRYLLDVCAFLSAVLLGLVLVIKKLWNYCKVLKKCCASAKKESKSEKKKKTN